MWVGKVIERTGILARVPDRVYHTTAFQQRFALLRSFEGYLRDLVDYKCIFGLQGGFSARISYFDFKRLPDDDHLALCINFEVEGTPPGDKENEIGARTLAIDNLRQKLQREFPVLGLMQPTLPVDEKTICTHISSVPDLILTIDLDQ